MEKLILKFFPLIDILVAPFVYPAAWLLKSIRHGGIHRFPICRRILLKVGVFPLRDHFYEPQFNHNNATIPFSSDRALPGIKWNVDEQLALLDRLTFADELDNLPMEASGNLEFYMNNASFAAGDAEYWYQMIRHVRPKRIFEVGSGNSTLMAIRAVKENMKQDPGYRCKHVCIEPYKTPWLEQAGVLVHRQKVEDIELSFFSELESGDILFIDSSHVIRPQGDVLFEYLQLLPSLNEGVIVHVHDIFSPKNYPEQWLKDEVRLWNEQYLLEAFLSHNADWRVIGALNYLAHNHYEKLHKAAPYLTTTREPGSFYIQKIAAT